MGMIEATVILYSPYVFILLLAGIVVDSVLRGFTGGKF